MKKIGLLFKEASENRIKTSLKESSNAFIIRYSGLSSPDITLLRQSLKASASSLFVVKNSIAKRALKELGLDSLINKVEGPCGLIFSKDDPAGTAKILYNFSRGHEQLKLEGGVFKNRIIDTKDIERLASLPSKEVLRAQAVMVIKFPLSGLARVLSQVLRKFVYSLKQIKKQKENAEV